MIILDDKKYSMKQYCYPEGKGTKPCFSASFDGYSLYDRTFEGVDFTARMVGEHIHISWPKSDNNYMNRFNMVWLKNLISEMICDLELQSGRDGYDDDVMVKGI